MMSPDSPVQDTQAMIARIRQAFAKLRQHDASLVAALDDLGPAAVPELARYARDPHEGVRREAVALLVMLAGTFSLPALVQALEDSVPEIQERAAQALYEKYDIAELAEQPELGQALARQVSGPEPSAAAVLLLSYFPTDETQEALTALRDRRDAPQVKLYGWSTPVDVAWPARVALARLGDPEAQDDLVVRAAKATPAEAEFLLQALREADTSTVLRGLARFLDDTREATTLVHSAPEIRRRLCDLAADAFAARLELTTSFERTGFARYTPEQLAEVRDLVEQAVPKSPPVDPPA